MTTDEQRQAILASIDVWCCGCGHNFPGTTRLHNGLCDDCVREARKRPWEILAENERLRSALRQIRDDEGQVCDGYELCNHRACRSSYTAWAIANKALAWPMSR